VTKPVDGAGGYGIVIGPASDEPTLERLRANIERDPRGFIAQRPVGLSTMPTFVDGALEPRHIDLRPFAVNDGHDVWVVPGGLTRVALARGSLIVNSSQGGGSKDTWVLARPRDAAQPAEPLTTTDRPDAVVTSDALPRDAILAGPVNAPPEQQQQQQQQQ
jgi:uncharacterized circularly permuted ATP-grasp superfamily protein